ncbi:MULTISPECIES: hypothetical protein [Peribacillus]|uniref:hypothetical protein n=1 Tax=Peribacillus TaxID=2675229 RepID=UPI001F4EC561|nr:MULTISPECIES: hypothetical protein [unclassified Peribacillus]MCK1982202.1 hypothetical protein [Peribacillus sp. Aquil_B1]MCK2007446.1 hypothetical protein [Peribacillus sp. Aquil_B8]
MKSIVRINNLIDQHGDYIKCKDKRCPICAEIKKLSDPLKNDSVGKKIRQVLSKDEDMTTGDVRYLIESGARKMDIRKALGMKEVPFIKFLDDIGLKKGKREVNKDMKISKGEYEAFKYKGKTDGQIAKEIGVTGATINYYKKKWYPKQDPQTKPKSQTKEYQEVKEKVAAVVAVDENAEKLLRLRITELEQQAKEYPELINKVEKLEEANIHLGNENSRLLLLKDQKSEVIKQLKDAAGDLEDEIGDLKDEVELLKKDSNEWKQKAQYYASENEIMVNQYKDTRNALESQVKEIGLYRALLKEVL